MSNFVTDNTTLSFPKVDLNPVGTGDPTKFIAALEWNTLCQAAYDLRGATPKYTAGDPNGVLLGAKGDIARDTTNGKIWINTTGGTIWKAATVLNVAPTPGTYGPGVSLTVDAQGLVTAASTAVVPGRFLARQVLTGASGTYTPTPGTAYAKVWMLAAGGGGGGATPTGGTASGAGGSSGTLLHFTVGAFGGAAITGGAWTGSATGGAAGSSAGGNGGAGADATLVINGTTFTAKGGGGGTGSPGAATFGNWNPTAPAAGTTAVGDSAYAPGLVGILMSSAAWSGAGGGIAPWGTGGALVGTSNNGNNATGFGAGGSGACTSVGGKTGGVGSPTKIIIEEFS